VKRRRSRDVVRVCVPIEQAPLFHVPGPHGGWFASLLYGHGYSVDVSMQELCKLLAGSRGEVIVARQLTRAEAGLIERRRLDCDADAHAGIITTEQLRFQRPRRGGRV
jgi:hypothetical protein